jgi:hypothetical protein
MPIATETNVVAALALVASIPSTLATRVLNTGTVATVTVAARLSADLIGSGPTASTLAANNRRQQVALFRRRAL